MQQQRPSKLPLVIGVVLIVATIARHRRRAAADWPEGAAALGRRPSDHHDHRSVHARHGRHGLFAARMAECAERLTAERGIEYV